MAGSMKNARESKAQHEQQEAFEGMARQEAEIRRIAREEALKVVANLPRDVKVTQSRLFRT